MASYNLTVTGTPEEGDIITLTYTTVNQLSVSVNFPSPGNGTLTIQKNGSNVATFGANSSPNVTANISVPTKLSELTDNLGSNPTHTHSQYLTTHKIFRVRQILLILQELQQAEVIMIYQINQLH